MSKRQIVTTGAPTPGGAYSQALVVDGTFYSSGMGPENADGSGVVGATVAEQTAQTLRNLSAALESAGLTLRDVIKVTVHLQHLRRDFADFNRAYAQFLTKPYPVRTTVGSDLPGILVEIDVIARGHRRATASESGRS